MKITNNNQTFEFEITLKNIKSIIIKIDSNKSIKISAPRYITQKQIKDFIILKWNWIKKSLEKVERQTANRFVIEPNSSITMLENTYYIEIKLSTANNIQIDQNKLIFYCIDNSQDTLKQIMINFLKNYNYTFFNSLLIKCSDKANIGFVPDLSLRYMVSRWGVCHINKKKIVLNSVLSFLPIECIEYVIMHELTHFYHANHSKDFYNKLSQFFPEYKGVETILKNFNVRMLE